MWQRFFNDNFGRSGTILPVAIERLLPACMSESDLAPGLDSLAAFQLEFDYLCRTLRRLGVPSADLEDLVHEVFLVLHRRWADYDSSRALRPWLFGIAFRVASAHRKRRTREIPQATFELADPNASADHGMVEDQARRLVLAALERLPLERRAVLVLHDLDEVAMRDIAKTLSIPLFTAYSRLRKARTEFESAVRMLQNGTRSR